MKKRERKKGLPKWLVAIIVGLFGSEVFLDTVNDVSQKRIDKLPDGRNKLVWQIVKDNGLETIEILTNENENNREEFEKLIEKNIDILIPLGVRPFRVRSMGFATKMGYGEEKKELLHRFFKDLEEDAKSFDLIQYIKDK